MGSKKSSNATVATSTQQQDNRVIAGDGAIALAAGSRYSYADTGDKSVSNVTTINASDPGAVRLGELNAQLLGMVAETNTDAVKSIAAMGADGIRAMGQSVTDLYGRAGSNVAESWGETVDASERLIGKILSTAQQSTDAARVISQSAMSSYQPAENKAQEVSLKLGMIAAAGVAAMVLLRKG